VCTGLNALPFPVYTSALISVKLAVQPATSTTLQDHGYGLVYRAKCLFTPLAFAGYSFQLTHKKWLRLSIDMGACWFCAEVIYPSKDGHPSRH